MFVKIRSMDARELWPTIPEPWPPEFPEVLTHVSLRQLYAASLVPAEASPALKSANYQAAKAGDPEAAAVVVEALINPEAIASIADHFARAVVVAVHAEEESGTNQLPLAYAQAVADIAGLEAEEEIVQTTRSNHTRATARQRLARRARFDGPVERGRQYIVLDDVVTSGATLADLRHFIVSRGAEVVLATTLATAPVRYGRNPKKLAITAAAVKMLQIRFDADRLNHVLFENGIAPSLNHLTESEAHIVAGFSDIDSLRNSLAATKQARIF